MKRFILEDFTIEGEVFKSTGGLCVINHPEKIFLPIAKAIWRKRRLKIDLLNKEVYLTGYVGDNKVSPTYMLDFPEGGASNIFRVEDIKNFYFEINKKLDNYYIV